MCVIGRGLNCCIVILQLLPSPIKDAIDFSSGSAKCLAEFDLDAESLQSLPAQAQMRIVQLVRKRLDYRHQRDGGKNAADDQVTSLKHDCIDSNDIQFDSSYVVIIEKCKFEDMCRLGWLFEQLHLYYHLLNQVHHQNEIVFDIRILRYQ